MRHRKLTEHQHAEVVRMAKVLLHASRDWQRNKGEDTTKSYHNVNSPYYAEAFGIMRGLALVNHGNLVGGNSPFGLRTWFNNLANEVLKEENIDGSNECDFCLQNYGKDAIRNRRQHA